MFSANQLLFPGFRFGSIGRRRLWGRAAKACLLGGGTYVNDKESIEPIARIQRRMPFLLVGVGVQNPSYWSTTSDYVDTRAEWSRILQASPFVGVRGPHSLAVLHDQGYFGARIVGDPVLSLASRTVTPRNGRHVGINLGSTRNRLWGADDGAVYRVFRELASRLIREGFTVSFLAVCPEDTATLSQLRHELGAPIALHNHYVYTPAVASYFGSVDVFVGLKLHSVVLAHCAYVPSLMIEYRPKCADYMASLRLEAQTFRSDCLEADRLYEAIRDLRQNRGAHQEALFTGIAEMNELQRAFAQEITEYVRGL